MYPGKKSQTRGKKTRSTAMQVGREGKGKEKAIAQQAHASREGVREISEDPGVRAPCSPLSKLSNGWYRDVVVSLTFTDQSVASK